MIKIFNDSLFLGRTVFPFLDTESLIEVSRVSHNWRLNVNNMTEAIIKNPSIGLVNFLIHFPSIKFKSVCCHSIDSFRLKLEECKIKTQKLITDNLFDPSLLDNPSILSLNLRSNYYVDISSLNSQLLAMTQMINPCDPFLMRFLCNDRVRVLNASGFQITDKDLRLFVNLEELTIDGCSQLRGEFLLNMVELKILQAKSCNNFQFDLYLRFCENLEILILDSSKFYGTVFKELGKLNRLSVVGSHFRDKLILPSSIRFLATDSLCRGVEVDNDDVVRYLDLTVCTSSSVNEILSRFSGFRLRECNFLNSSSFQSIDETFCDLRRLQLVSCTFQSNFSFPSVLRKLIISHCDSFGSVFENNNSIQSLRLFECDLDDLTHFPKKCESINLSNCSSIDGNQLSKLEKLKTLVVDGSFFKNFENQCNAKIVTLRSSNVDPMVFGCVEELIVEKSRVPLFGKYFEEIKLKKLSIIHCEINPLPEVVKANYFHFRSIESDFPQPFCRLANRTKDIISYDIQWALRLVSEASLIEFYKSDEITDASVVASEWSSISLTKCDRLTDRMFDGLNYLNFLMIDDCKIDKPFRDGFVIKTLILKNIENIITLPKMIINHLEIIGGFQSTSSLLKNVEGLESIILHNVICDSVFPSSIKKIRLSHCQNFQLNYLESLHDLNEISLKSCQVTSDELFDFLNSHPKILSVSLQLKFFGDSYDFIDSILNVERFDDLVGC